MPVKVPELPQTIGRVASESMARRLNVKTMAFKVKKLKGVSVEGLKMEEVEVLEVLFVSRWDVYFTNSALNNTKVAAQLLMRVLPLDEGHIAAMSKEELKAAYLGS
ncbi:hypothetical protein NE237_023471 [Protea cynaroides]|uniref:Uncharacterized protein n=1 Tax=Protea cynaroides TaxID=273540 RepID=A0A9Q0HBT0_9MAGN|nr:hypothetical protein NE237_023471 [Protea cynaroides]